MPTSTSSAADPVGLPGLDGAILAAGQGRRMGALSWLPKALLPLRGRPVIAYQLELFRRLGVERVVVVVGRRKGMILDYLETTGRSGGSVEVVEQREPRGAGDALLCLERWIRRPFVLFLGDIVLLPNTRLRELAEPVLRGDCSATLAVVQEPDPERLAKNFRVEVNGDDRVLEVVEKPSDGRPGLKGCGLYAFTPDVFRAARSTPRTPRGTLGITEPIQTLIDVGLPVRAARVCRWDANLTRPEDLASCEAFLEGLEAGRIPPPPSRKEVQDTADATPGTARPAGVRGGNVEPTANPSARDIESLAHQAAGRHLPGPPQLSNAWRTRSGSWRKTTASSRRRR